MKLKIKTTLLNLCPYTHLWRAGRRMITDRKLPESARPGACIALLGLFCPLFWIALFSGAGKGELIFHAIHSGVVFLIGIVMLLVGLAKESRNLSAKDPTHCRSVRARIDSDRADHGGKDG
ncbi:hypothetical protein [Pseudorhodobacter turbinis]|nr:hypothetical protein [Pseudorhodobacter turbinis]